MALQNPTGRTLGSQNANNVSITGGSVQNLTSLTLASGAVVIQKADGGIEQRNAGTVYYDFTANPTDDFHARFFLNSATDFQFNGATGLTFTFNRPVVFSSFNASGTFTGMNNLPILLNPTTGLSAIRFQLNGSNRWDLLRTDGTDGSNFRLNNYDDAGVAIGNPFRIERLTGRTTVTAFGFRNPAGTFTSTIDCVPTANRTVIFPDKSGTVVVRDPIADEIALKATTTNNTPTELLSNGAQLVVKNDSTLTFDGLVTARRTDADNESAGWYVQGVIDRNATAASTAFLAIPTKTAIAKDQTAWDLLIDIDTSTGAVRFRGQGENGKTITWHSNIRFVEVVG